MHARHRNPGNGYRSSSMGMGGVAAGSRISPDGAVRSHAVYSSEYRSHSRSFGRGQPKPFQPPQPPTRNGDIFMEAGRLASEYLVSKGILPQNAISGKWQNGSLKNQEGNFQSLRPQDGDLFAESRTSACLGDSFNDSGAGSKRRFPDEYNLADSRDYMRGRRRMGSFKNYGSEWNREYGRSSSWSEKSGVSPDKAANDDASYGYQEEEQVSKDNSGGEQKSQSSEIASKNDITGNSESPSEKNQLPDDVASKASSSSTGKNLLSEADLEPAEKPECMEIISVGNGEVKNDGSDHEMQKHSATEDLPLQPRAEDVRAIRNGNDLLRLCAFAKVPTKTRSSLTSKLSKVSSASVGEGKSADESALDLSGAPIEVMRDGSSGDAPSSQTPSLKIIDPNISDVKPKEEHGELGISYAGLGKCTRSRSFPERSLIKQDSSEGLPGFGRCSTMDSENGRKQTIQHSDSMDGSRKPIEWIPTIDAQVDKCLHISTSMQKQPSSHVGRNSSGEEVILAVDRKKLLDISLSPNYVAEPCLDYTEEKQQFPGSFKICDLNLMGASDPNENHENNPILIYPSIPHSQAEAGHVDIDLSMSNSCNIPDKICRRGADGKEVEVIDLESDSVQDDKIFNNPDNKDETLFTGLDNLTNNTQNVNDIHGVQDGYGLMISELLGTDLPNCSSAQPGVSSLQNEMGLNNGEDILGDDDSIYMSLGEIPISFLHVWNQQPTQEFEKPY